MDTVIITDAFQEYTKRGRSIRLVFSMILYEVGTGGGDSAPFHFLISEVSDGETYPIEGNT